VTTVAEDRRVNPGAALLKRVAASLASRTEAAAWRAFEASKPAFNVVSGRQAPAAHLFVFGCQRSGTTHLERLFRADPRSAVHGEFSGLSIRPDSTVWRPMFEIRAELGRQRCGYTVSRSLLASDFVAEVLDAVPNSAAVWLYRDAPSVVRSMVNKWGRDFRAISERVETDAEGGWRLRELWDAVEQEADRMGDPARDEDARIRDIYALYWLRRNRIALEAGLAGDPRTMVLSYETLTTAPEQTVARLLSMVGLRPPGVRFPLETRSRPGLAAKPDMLSREVEARCDALYRELAEQEARSS